ncbi:peptidase M42 family protein [Halalkaliarchaeum desulfuricum]|uniref:Peptidase M42 family protein n=1 Tax=Halalkaliarchaeum desulfuricum TaxID=2055893 RepID=A0A343TLI0_9EURY|nr:peptidase M42 family protein [Halalkaliarchaeum desulfuricum]
MHERRREFLKDLLSTPSPSGFETAGQRVWCAYVREFADEVGYIVRDVTDDGFLRIAPIGGADRTVSKGQHVTIHADEPVQGVIGQTAIHLRDVGEEESPVLLAETLPLGVSRDTR